jgi:DNA-binding FadR family transcriptional regulator
MVLTEYAKVGHSVRLPKAAELVAGDLRAQVVRRDLQDGDLLPPEAVLANGFGVSRPTIREALRILESERLLTIHRGSQGGARVHAPKCDVAAWYAGLVLLHRSTPVGDVLAARCLIEADCAARLASSRTDIDLDALSKCLLRGDEDITLRSKDFHRLVVDLAGNETLHTLAQMLEYLLDTPAPSDTGKGADRETTHHCTNATVHQNLVEFIERRDAEGARTMWTKHVASWPQEGHFTTVAALPPR